MMARPGLTHDDLGSIIESGNCDLLQPMTGLVLEKTLHLTVSAVSYVNIE